MKFKIFVQTNGKPIVTEFEGTEEELTKLLVRYPIEVKTSKF